MDSVQCFCLFVIFVLSGNIAGVSASRHQQHQTSDHLQPPFLQHLQRWGAGHSSTHPHEGDQDAEKNLNTLVDQVSGLLIPDSQGMENKGADMGSLLQLVNSVQQTSKDKVEFQLTDGHRNGPEVSVVVETLSAEDLLASERGRQQLSQLNAQLEQAVSSLSQGVQMVQGPEKMVENFQNISAEMMLGRLVNLVVGGGVEGQMMLGMVGSQSMQAVNQLTHALDQLPGLKSLLEMMYKFVERLHASHPSAVKDMQQLFANAVTVFQGTSGGMEQGGQLMEMDSMLEMALQGLNANLELLEFVVNKMQQTAENPSFLPAVNSAHCLMKSLRGELSPDISVGCLEQLMQAIAMINQSEQAITTLLHSLNQLLDNAHVMQSFTDLVNMPSLDKAFSMMHAMMEDLNEANADVMQAIQTLQNMLQSLLKNKPLLETLANLIQSPDSSQVYENAMQFLKDAAADDPVTQQLLKVVNDSISMMWQEGNAQNVVEKLQEILTVLKTNQQTTDPLSQSQQALLDLLDKLLYLAQNAANGETSITPTFIPTVATTARPVDNTTKHDVDRTTAATSSDTTKSSPSSSARSSFSTTTSWTTTRPTPTTTKVSGEGEGPSSSSSPTLTPNPGTNDDNGSAHLSLSAFTLITALFASAFSL